MTNDKGIFIKNIYYMLCYAFQNLEQSNYENVKKEDFDDIENLFAEILSIAVAQQLKQGLYREYVTKNESLSTLRGKLTMPETIRNKMQRKQKLACEFDELSENNLMNQILKTTMRKLILFENVKPAQKNALKNELRFFNEVKLLDRAEIKRIKWDRLQYQRNNKNYKMLMTFCSFVLDPALPTTEGGDYRIRAFTEKQLDMLYQRFVLAYYQKHHSDKEKGFKAKSANVEWNLVGKPEESIGKLLPGMKTDITLHKNGKTLIIDTKYYGEITQGNRGKRRLHNDHLYQIYAYVKNMDKEHSGNVAGLLLYAKTQEEIVPDGFANVDGNKIGAKTLDLNQKFSDIASQLDKIAEEFETYFAVLVAAQP